MRGELGWLVRAADGLLVHNKLCVVLKPIALNPLLTPLFRYENYRREHGQNFSFDWYVDPKKIAPILELHIGIENDRGKKIMIFGCGNSKLSEVLYDLGYRSITSVDTSTVVVSQMQYRYKNREGMDFMVADVMKVSLPRPAIKLVCCSWQPYLTRLHRTPTDGHVPGPLLRHCD
jgi:SAM-dependent methyltransferase